MSGPDRARGRGGGEAETRRTCPILFLHFSLFFLSCGPCTGAGLNRLTKHLVARVSDPHQAASSMDFRICWWGPTPTLCTQLCKHLPQENELLRISANFVTMKKAKSAHTSMRLPSRSLGQTASPTAGAGRTRFTVTFDSKSSFSFKISHNLSPFKHPFPSHGSGTAPYRGALTTSPPQLRSADRFTQPITTDTAVRAASRAINALRWSCSY